ncbi:hypothetical protein ES703_107389 [subsurface metagenome]
MIEFAFLPIPLPVPDSYLVWNFNAAGTAYVYALFGSWCVFCVVQHFDFLDRWASGLRYFYYHSTEKGDGYWPLLEIQLLK